MRLSLLAATIALALSVAAPVQAMSVAGAAASSAAKSGSTGSTGATAPAGKAGSATAPAAATPTTTYAPSAGTPPAATTPAPGTTGTRTATTPSTTPSQALFNKRFGKATKKPTHHNGLGALAIIIAALAALVVLACAAWAVARQRAYEPHWWLSLRHAMAEAGFRTSATWAEFTDWARLGR
jgi:hypothetical protein